MAAYRARKSTPDSTSIAIDPALAAFNARQLPALRKVAIRHLLDVGMTEAAVYNAFATRPDLARLISGLSNAVVAIRKDLAAVHREDEGTPQVILDAERTLRLARETFDDPTLTASGRVRALTALQRATETLAVLRREAVKVPGRGLVARDGYEETRDFEDADDGLPHETHEYDWHVGVRGLDDPIDGMRRRIAWAEGYQAPRPIRPTPDARFTLPNVECHLLPPGLIRDKQRRGQVLDERGRVVGRFRMEDDEVLADQLVLVS